MSRKKDINRLQATHRFLETLDPTEYDLDQLANLVTRMANATHTIRVEVLGRAQRAGQIVPIPKMEVH